MNSTALLCRLTLREGQAESLAAPRRPGAPIGRYFRPTTTLSSPCCHTTPTPVDAPRHAVDVGLLDEYRPVPHLGRHDGEPWHLHFHRREAGVVAGWLASCAVALATVIGGDRADRLGVCAAPRCDRVYVDVTRNGTRRFCSTACQSRVKAAAHRARYA